jgi:hypothetical protein
VRKEQVGCRCLLGKRLVWKGLNPILTASQTKRLQSKTLPDTGLTAIVSVICLHVLKKPRGASGVICQERKVISLLFSSFFFKTWFYFLKPNSGAEGGCRGAR